MPGVRKVVTTRTPEVVQVREYRDENVDRKLEFVLCMYGMKYEEKKTLNARINEILKRFFSRNSEDLPVKRSAFRKKRVSFSPFLNGVRPLTWGDVRSFKNALESFAYEITEIINGPPNNIYCLATRAFQFQKEWNELVKMNRGQFLEGFGDILMAELRLPKASNIILLLIKLRKAQSVPRELESLHDKLNSQSIVTSMEAYVDFQTRMADDPPPRRQLRRRRRVLRRVIRRIQDQRQN